MKKIIFIAAAGTCLFLFSCQKSWEDRCYCEALEYTQTHCPQDMGSGIWLDSLTYDRSTNTNTYYYRATLESDNKEDFEKYGEEIKFELLSGIANSIDLKPYKEHRVCLRYIYTSESTGKVLLESLFGPDDEGTYEEKK